MKIDEIDFKFLDRLVAAGATAGVIVEVLKEAKQAEKRERERERQAAKRGNNEQQSPTSSNIEQHPPTPERPSEAAERELYAVAKQHMGQRCGGLVASLIRHHNYDLAAARRVVDLAITKQDPREYLVASMRSQNGQSKRSVHDATNDLLKTLNEPVPSDLRDGAGEDPVRRLPPR